MEAEEDQVVAEEEVEQRTMISKLDWTVYGDSTLGIHYVDNCTRSGAKAKGVGAVYRTYF